MDCPKCGTLIFDAYTDEERIRQLYNCHTTAGWAKDRLKVLIDMLDENQPHVSDYVSLDWLRKKLSKIEAGITLIKVSEEKENV